MGTGNSLVNFLCVLLLSLWSACLSYLVYLDFNYLPDFFFIWFICVLGSFIITRKIGKNKTKSWLKKIISLCSKKKFSPRNMLLKKKRKNTLKVYFEKLFLIFYFYSKYDTNQTTLCSNVKRIRSTKWRKYLNNIE